MGNAYSYSQISQDLPDAHNYKFFTNLNIRWLEKAVVDLRSKGRITLKEVSVLCWKDYFTTFKKIKDYVVNINVELERKYWHPACRGYSMTHAILDEGSAGDTETDNGENEDEIDADFTNDEASESSELSSQLSHAEEKGKKKSPKRKSAATPSSNNSNFNAQINNPIFFGYSNQLEADMLVKSKAMTKAVRDREQRALNNAMKARATIVDAFEKKALQQHAYRMKKMNELRNSYENAKKKREEEYKEGLGQLQGELLRLIKNQKAKEDSEAERAFQIEMGDLMAKHEEKSFADKANIKDKRDELEAFKDMEAQESPAAERLEQFSRLEIHRCGEELRKSMSELSKIQSEFEAIRVEYEQRLEAYNADETPNKKIDKRLIELRSMANIAETRLREAQGVTAARLEDLADANALLSRAVIEKEQQNEFLPLFNVTKLPERYPPACEAVHLLICCVVLSKGSFDEKLNFLIQSFGEDFSYLFKVDFVLALGGAIATSLRALGLIQMMLSTAELENLLLRIFSSFGLDPKRDVLTDYETKALFRLVLCKNELLMKLFHISAPGVYSGSADLSYGTYQLNKMHPLISFASNLLDFSSCLDRVHHSVLREKDLLAPPMKRKIHELAMSMGLNDPLAPDYSHFFIKAERKSSYRVEPLDNGLFTHVDFYSMQKKSLAATKIQSIARQYLDRKFSERATKQMAIQEAKLTAIKELKTRILREYQKRENARGVGKMKWDAEVRMKQAKLRAAGQAVSRSDVVMLMVEEALGEANKAIDQKFQELQLFSEPMVERKSVPTIDSVLTIPFQFSTIYTLFDMRDESAVSIKILESDGQGREMTDSAGKTGDLISTKASTKASTKGESDDASLRQSLRDTASVDTKDQHSLSQSGGSSTDIIENQTPAQERMMDIVRGVAAVALLCYEASSNTTQVTSAKQGMPVPAVKFDKAYRHGELAMEAQLRRILSRAEPQRVIHLYFRLRLLDKVMTDFKVGEVMAEMPSKRLLLKYLAGNDDIFLRSDLKSHFKFKKNVWLISQYFRNLEITDTEYGILRRQLSVIQNRLERGILTTYREHLFNKVAAFRDSLELRKEANSEGKGLPDFAEEELKRVLILIANHDQQYKKVVLSYSNERNNLQRIAKSLEFCEDQLKTVTEFSNSGKALSASVPIKVRCDWTGRYYNAMRKSASKESQQLVFKELSSIVTEFLDVVKSDAKMLIHDLFQPEHARNIAVFSVKEVKGRAEHSGRGIRSKKSWYFAHNIFYRVALDYDGIYNGSDEFAAKAANFERIAALEYMNVSIERLRSPLVATIDYHGYRVLAVALMPIQHVAFDENGEVQRMSEDLVHGMTNEGNYFVNRSQLLNKLLKLAGVKLNLAEHKVKGLRDLSAATTCASGLLKVYRGSDEQFYLRNCANILPCEPPSSTPHLTDVPRLQSIFWRRIRPEFLRTRSVPLSSDACTLLTNNTSDAESCYQSSKEAMNIYLQELIPDFVQNLLMRQYNLPLAEGLGIQLSEEMHKRGINIRHLGLMRNLIRRALPGNVSVYTGEKFIRTSHNLSVEVENGESIYISGLVFKLEETRRNKITTTTLPISHKHKQDPINRAVAYYGRIQYAQNCDEVRLILLGEMIARCVKNCVRFQLRSYVEMNKGCSLLFWRELIAQHLNFVTGSSDNASTFFEDIIYESILERFGKYAVRISERKGLLNATRPIILYIVRRIVEMCGATLVASTWSSLAGCPVGFSFHGHDIVDVHAIVKHNIAVFPFAEAVMVAQEAEEAMAKLYMSEVRNDSPSLFFNLSERKGGRAAINYGLLGDKYNGLLTPGCDLEQTGPIKTDKFLRAIGFHPDTKSCIDCNHHEAIVPVSIESHFSVEVFFRCLGGKDINRTLIDSGRYRLSVGRDNYLSFTLYESVHSMSLRCCLIDNSDWYHMIATFDGTFLRCYINTDLKYEVEVCTVLAQKERAYLVKHQNKLVSIGQDEVDEKAKLREKTMDDARVYFQTKEGMEALKRISQRLVEEDGFNPEEQNESEEPLNGRQKRAIVLRKAKEELIEEIFEKNKIELAARFQQLRIDEEEQYHKILQGGKVNVLKPFRVGASLPDASNREGSDYFFGHISCISVYDRCLSSDRVRAHYLSTTRNPYEDAQRLYAKAAAKFIRAYSEGSSFSLFDADVEQKLLDLYAKSLCSFLYLDPEVRNKSDVDAAKVKLQDLLSLLKARRFPEIIVAIIKSIPRDPDFADIIVSSLLSLKAIHRHYLSTTLLVSRDALAFLPFELALVSPFQPYSYYEAAAFVFQQVVRDHNFQFIYGELDLNWLVELESPLLIVSIVKCAYEDRQLKVVKILELIDAKHMPGHAGLPTDSDVQALVQNAPLLEGFDFSNCSSLTNSSLEYLNRIARIRSLNLSGCTLLNDQGLHLIPNILNNLERLALQNVVLLTDEGVEQIADHCKKLVYLNLNGCYQVSVAPLLLVAKRNKFLSNLQLSRLLIIDDGLVELCGILQDMKILELDISHCSAITDVGVGSIADSCQALRRLNLQGLNRVSHRSVQMITTRCWDLQVLNLEDVFLTNDKIFIYEAACDGRAAANDSMLVNMKELTVTDCLAVSDRGMHGLADRCRLLERLNLRGCDKLTDTTLSLFADETVCPRSNFALAATLISLDLSYCTHFTRNGLEAVLSKCQALYELNLSGWVSTVDDDCIRMIGAICPTIQALRVKQCWLITDMALCYAAESLWLEVLDVSGCHRITDQGIEVLAEAYSALQSLSMDRLKLGLMLTV
eukprot:scaffold644_cov168-Ochromonas_danica.AAC.46